MRDPTRGGLAATLNEFAHASRLGFSLDEAAIPVRAEVAAACEFLGLDPLNIANEGKLVAVVTPEGAQALVAAMRAHPLGREAAVIGRAVEDGQCFVEMRTAFGGGRIVDWLAGEQLPRICQRFAFRLICFVRKVDAIMVGLRQACGRASRRRSGATVHDPPAVQGAAVRATERRRREKATAVGFIMHRKSATRPRTERPKPPLDDGQL